MQQEIKQIVVEKESGNIWKINHLLHCVQSKKTEHLIIGQEKKQWNQLNIRKVY